jgi:RNA polymerase sigma-70 factor (ECF subfamily)
MSLDPRPKVTSDEEAAIGRASAATDLIRRAQTGEVGAFEAIYREHAGRIFALCLRLSGDGARAEELMQDVFVRAWERLGSFRGESALSTWLHRLAVNEVLTTLRSDRRRTARVGSAEDLGAPDAPAPEVSPGQRIDLERAIAALPPGARTVFVLHDIEGYRHPEIARMTGLAEGTLRAQLHRARRLLMEALDR